MSFILAFNMTKQNKTCYCCNTGYIQAKYGSSNHYVTVPCPDCSLEKMNEMKSRQHPWFHNDLE